MSRYHLFQMFLCSFSLVDFCPFHTLPLICLFVCLYVITVIKYSFAFSKEMYKCECPQSSTNYSWNCCFRIHMLVIHLLGIYSCTFVSVDVCERFILAVCPGVQAIRRSARRILPQFLWLVVSWQKKALITPSYTLMTKPAEVRWTQRPTWWPLASTTTKPVGRLSWWASFIY